MEKKIKIIVVLLVALVVVGISLVFGSIWIAQENYKKVQNIIPPAPEAPHVTYNVNTTADTITITSISGNPGELIWSNVELLNSSVIHFQATLPTGTIDIGDVITDCDGPVLLIWKPTGARFIEGTFI
jgi:hypothetical protein